MGAHEGDFGGVLDVRFANPSGIGALSIDLEVRNAPLFPHFSKISSADRATRFANRCKKLDITGVSLHCYRYAWAEGAEESGYPERFARRRCAGNPGLNPNWIW